MLGRAKVPQLTVNQPPTDLELADDDAQASPAISLEQKKPGQLNAVQIAILQNHELNGC